MLFLALCNTAMYVYTRAQSGTSDLLGNVCSLCTTTVTGIWYEMRICGAANHIKRTGTSQYAILIGFTILPAGLIATSEQSDMHSCHLLQNRINAR